MSYEVVQLIASNEPWTGNGKMSYEVVLIASNELIAIKVMQLIASNEPWTGNQMSYEVVQLIWGGATNC